MSLPPSQHSAQRSSWKEALSHSPEARARGVVALLAIGLATSYEEELSLEGLAKMKQRFRDAMVRDPLDALGAMVLSCSYLFWIAERDDNPKCPGFLDALVFVTTSLSVGYDDVFARTDAGKVIASFVMSFGPALAASAFDKPAQAGEQQQTAEVNQAILGRLDAILDELRRRP